MPHFTPEYDHCSRPKALLIYYDVMLIMCLYVAVILMEVHHMGPRNG